MDYRPADPVQSAFLGDEKGSEPHAKMSFIDRHLIDARTILVTGPVTDEMAEDVTARAMIMEKLDRERPITVMINSPGGSADSGFAIYDILRFVAPPVRTVVNGLCASAGILIHLAGDKGTRYVTPESRFMIHQPSTAGRGTASDLDITAKEVIKLRERYVKIISDATGQDPERVLEDARRDFWLNATEAKEYNLVDAIVASRADLPE